MNQAQYQELSNSTLLEKLSYELYVNDAEQVLLEPYMYFDLNEFAVLNLNTSKLILVSGKKLISKFPDLPSFLNEQNLFYTIVKTERGPKLKVQVIDNHLSTLVLIYWTNPKNDFSVNDLLGHIKAQKFNVSQTELENCLDSLFNKINYITDQKIFVSRATDGSINTNNKELPNPISEQEKKLLVKENLPILSNAIEQMLQQGDNFLSKYTLEQLINPELLKDVIELYNKTSDQHDLRGLSTGVGILIVKKNDPKSLIPFIPHYVKLAMQLFTNNNKQLSKQVLQLNNDTDCYSIQFALDLNNEVLTYRFGIGKYYVAQLGIQNSVLTILLTEREFTAAQSQNFTPYLQSKLELYKNTISQEK